MITITKKEYNKLLKRDKFLSALEAAGVDNWGGYSVAFEILEKNPTSKSVIKRTASQMKGENY